MASLIFSSFLVVFLYMSLWWVVALIRRRNDIADVAWGLGFIVVALALYFQNGELNAKTVIVLSMIIIWGMRLVLHIAIRHLGKPEDIRYQKMREGWRFERLQSYTHVFLIQGLFLLLVSTPIILFFGGSQSEIQWYNILGLGIWCMGFLFEAIGDYQLARFIKAKTKKDRIMRYGLWKYSRHPNYFGEISLWWGFYIFTLFTPYWYVGVIGPITITYLIIGVSGIPMLEKRYIGDADYEQYQKTTSAFFPLPPKGRV